jgi:Secretion system C-terminal sorting domain
VVDSRKAHRLISVTYYFLRMKNALFLLFFLLVIISCNTSKTEPAIPIGDDELSNIEKRNLWMERMHWAAPGTDWRKVEETNAKNAVAIREEKRLLYGRTTTAESFAGGLLNGTWSERGPSNNNGSTRNLDYDVATNMVYAMSAGGNLWKCLLTGNNWTLLNDNMQFDARAFKVFTKSTGGKRIIVSSGQQLYWSDDDGATFNLSGGTFFPVAWKSNFFSKIIVLNDAAQTIYALTYNQDNIIGTTPRHYLFMSTDKGLTYTRINIFNGGGGSRNEVFMTNPYNTNLVYVTDITAVTNRIALYEINGATVTPISSATAVINSGASPLTGVQIGNVLTLYFLRNNLELYKRVNNAGVWGDWTFVKNTPVSSWTMLDVAMDDANKVYFGDIELYRSTNGGVGFTKASTWTAYYTNVAGSMHADVFGLFHFKRTDNTIFQLVNNDGGVVLSNDDLVTTTNLSSTTLNNSQPYDIITDTLNSAVIYSGTQDQGMQRTTVATVPGIFSTTQFISGDYGYLALTNNNTKLWGVYPGRVYYFANAATANYGASTVGSWLIPGTTVPNAGWMPPLKATANKAANEVFIGGGNTSGGAGSHLIKLVASGTTTLTPTQYPYDFRANSNNTTSGVSSLEVSLRDANKLYVATEDGTFFYSNDNAATWNKTATFSGTTGFYLYGQSIVASKITSGLVWYGGSGYSNPGVFKSTDGGVSFTAINNGLPPTLIHEMVANTTETMLFAATDAGPYVYVVANNQWYPMIGAITPASMYMAVEYIRSSNTVRFATHGRGIFDFVIQQGAVPVNGFNLAASLNNKKVDLKWTTFTETNNDYFEVQKSADGISFTKIGKVNSNGNGNSSTTQHYLTTDATPASGINFYRLKQVDKNGEISFSNIAKIKMAQKSEIIISPNPVVDNFSVSTQMDLQQIKLLDSKGKLVRSFTNASSYNISNLPKGVYILQIINKQNEIQTTKLFKQ